MTKTRGTVLEKQETRLKESLKEQEAKITEHDERWFCKCSAIKCTSC